MTKAAQRMANALRPLREAGGALGITIPASIVQTFLAVALREGRTVSDLARSAEVTMAAMSRQLDDLSERNRRGGQGLMLVRRDESGVRTHVNLTLKGKALAKKIAAAMLPKVSA
jgi:DNA-binding MarR family transcriptional regulator